MTWLALCTNLGVEDSLGQGHLFRYRVVVFSERAQSDVLRGVDVSMMWRGSKPQQAMGSNNHQGAAITDGGCAVLYASSTFHKHACMQANNTYRNQPKSRIVHSVTHVAITVPDVQSDKITEQNRSEHIKCRPSL